MSHFIDSRSQPSASAAIENLQWMAGSWSGQLHGDLVDECWSLPAGGVMMGMFRWLKNGAIYLYELMAIEPDANGLVLRLKHFDRGLVGWEDKGIALEFPLVHVGNHEAVFERGGAFRSTRFVYRRVAADDDLIVIAENRKGDEISRDEFRYSQLQLPAAHLRTD